MCSNCRQIFHPDLLFLYALLSSAHFLISKLWHRFFLQFQSPSSQFPSHFVYLLFLSPVTLPIINDDQWIALLFFLICPLFINRETSQKLLSDQCQFFSWNLVAVRYVFFFCPIFICLSFSLFLQTQTSKASQVMFNFFQVIFIFFHIFFNNLASIFQLSCNNESSLPHPNSSLSVALKSHVHVSIYSLHKFYTNSSSKTWETTSGWETEKAGPPFLVKIHT